MKITSNIKRLSLHDSHFEKEERNGNDIKLTFDWAKLEDYVEGKIGDGIIMGKTIFTIEGISNEKFKAYFHEEKFKLIEVPDNLGAYWQEVANTEIDGEKRRIMLDGYFLKGKDGYWVEWEFNYERCEVEWNSFVTYEEWRNGKLPED